MVTQATKGESKLGHSPAFWFTIITPAAILVGVGAALQYHEKQVLPALAVVSILYSAVGFLFARWLFMRAQDVQWTGGAIALPAWRRRRAGVSVRGVKAGRRPWRALFAKEFQLHQSQFIIAGVLVLLHLAVVAVRKFGGDWKTSAIIDVVINLFWATWLVMPWLVGCAAVAEERKLGTLEAQLCLPARRRAQFIIKLVSTLLVSVLLGAVMPVLLEGSRILPELHPGLSNYALTTPVGNFLRLPADLAALIETVLPFLTFAVFPIVIAFVSFYASTFSRSTLQAIAPAAVGVMAAFFLWGAASQAGQIFHYPLWSGPLVYFIGAPVMALTGTGLMYWNFKRAHVGWNVWRRNALVFLASLTFVTVATAAIYHRPWELFSAREVPHGAPRLAFSEPTVLRNEANGFTALFPDGRSWSASLRISAPTNFTAQLANNVHVALTNSGFLDGTNWASVARSHPSAVGIRKDGSLWVADPVRTAFRRGQRGPMFHPATNFVRLGTENDWKSVAYQSAPALLLKANGTLWRLGTNNMQKLKEWPGLLAFTPERLGADSDWAEILSEQGRILFRKTDGRAWMIPQYGASGKNFIELNGELRIYRAGYLDRVKSFLQSWARSRTGHGFQVGIFNDGSFRVIATWGQQGIEKQEVKLGTDSDWRAIAGNGIVTLKADGSLWEWNFTGDPIARPQTTSASRFSTHSDWLAVTSAMGGVVALAADGSIWFWRFDGFLLAASRRPQLIGNIFDSGSQ